MFKKKSLIALTCAILAICAVCSFAAPILAEEVAFAGPIRHGQGISTAVVTFDSQPAPAALDNLTASYRLHDGTVGKITFDAYDKRTQTMFGTWTDKHGSGPLHLTFNDDYSRFFAKWGDKHDGPIPEHVWNGTRKMQAIGTVAAK